MAGPGCQPSFGAQHPQPLGTSLVPAVLSIPNTGSKMHGAWCQASQQKATSDKGGGKKAITFVEQPLVVIS